MYINDDGSFSKILKPVKQVFNYRMLVRILYYIYIDNMCEQERASCLQANIEKKLKRKL